MLVGMDEVGRGSWAGPVVVGAVILRVPIAGLRDSKQLSVKRRENLAEQIKMTAFALALGQASAREIDELGLTVALALAYRRALEGIRAAYEEIIIDGAYNFLPDVPHVRTQIRADQAVPAVSAASIIAKVARDKLMAELAIQHPLYGFDKHVGYGTAAHAAALQQYGPCALHRRSFKPVKQVLVATA